EVHRTF
ncbi:unnamed protein product, partial [Allacma fusca]